MTDDTTTELKVPQSGQQPDPDPAPTEGVEKSQDGAIDPAEDKADETPDEGEQATEDATGFVGDVAGPDDQHAVQPVADAAPQDVTTERTDGVTDGSVISSQAPATMAEQVAPEPQTVEAEQGFVGDLPTDADGKREDLTLAGVLGLNVAPSAVPGADES